MIRLAGITKHYRMGDEEVRALDGVDLHIAANEYVALIGPSGSGKSTLMNLIGCLDTPTTGTYVLNGRDTSAMDDNALAKSNDKVYPPKILEIL
jgi:putative ABC transport system ATP-binding protein